jgi:hypothetical protein
MWCGGKTQRNGKELCTNMCRALFLFGRRQVFEARAAGVWPFVFRKCSEEVGRMKFD